MFGYIKPYKPELKLKEITKYSNAYCALCDQLKRDYGFMGRFVLNYDVTFLLLCQNYFDSNDEEFRRIRCPYNPLRVKMANFSKEALRYSAFINYWLVTEKLIDDYTDDKNIFKPLLRKILVSKKGFKSKSYRYQENVNELTELLREVYRSEQSIKDSFDFDRVTNTFGEFFSRIFVVTNISDSEAALLKKLMFQVGKWIYIIDAYDDFEKDIKKKRFNLLCVLGENGDIGKDEVFEKALAIHLQLKQKITALLRNIQDVFKDECIINILTFGLDNVFYKITEKKYKDFVGRLSSNGNDLLERVGK